MKRAGRQVAVSLAYSAQPFGISEQARLLGESATGSDIRRVYATPAKVFAAFPEKKWANAFWAEISRHNFARAQAIMQARCPSFHDKDIRPFDDGAAHRKNRGKRGRVPKGTGFAFVVQTTRDLFAYIKQEVGRVGFGKAGWGNSAKTLGGTRGLGSEDLGSAQWVTRHKNAPGGHVLDTNAQNPTLTLINGVDYASEILDPGEKAEAVSIALDRLSKAIFNEERRLAGANPL